MMNEADPAVAALGLESISLLCGHDALDFYMAWAVVRKTHAAPPSSPLVAAQWVGLLAHGALDMLVYPDRAAAIIDTLWATCQQNPSPKASNGFSFWCLISGKKVR
jgi:Protein of unknown function (DUF3730)